MKKNNHRFNFPLLLMRIILCCSCFILVNCERKIDFERNINFEKEWNKTNGLWNTKNATTFGNKFEINFKNDKIYLLQIRSPEKVLQLKLNNTIVYGNKYDDDKINYNITEQLKKQNTIELTKKSTSNFEAKIHCVNKLFIPNIEVKLTATENAKPSALVKVKIKNTFSTEKQGTLQYIIYSAKNKKIATKETPVFISGNAENLYQQKVNLDADNLNELKVVCQLFVDGKLLDRNKEVISKKRDCIEQN